MNYRHIPVTSVVTVFRDHNDRQVAEHYYSCQATLEHNREYLPVYVDGFKLLMISVKLAGQVAIDDNWTLAIELDKSAVIEELIMRGSSFDVYFEIGVDKAIRLSHIYYDNSRQVFYPRNILSPFFQTF